MKIRSISIVLGSFCYVSMSLHSVIADDTEIYVSRKLPEDQQIRPNLMFVIDNSGSMLEGVPGTTCSATERDNPNKCDEVVISQTCISYGWGGRCNTWRNNYEYRKTRLQVVKDVTNTLIDELRLSDDVNIGLMHFDAAVREVSRGNINYSTSYQGGLVAVPVTRVSTIANSFTTELNKLYAKGSTPLSETFYEAALYMKGAAPKFGNNTQAVDENGNNLANKPSVLSSRTGANYKTPIEYSCQKSNIILLTDGAPQLDNAANNDIRNLISRTGASNTLFTTSTANCRSALTNRTDRDSNEFASGECLPHLAEHLANQDASTSQPGKQTVNTYTIGFATNQALLQNTATAGNGRYFTTDNTSGLVDALKSILVEILAENTTFATPSVAVSAYNNLGYRNDLYYALFRPAEGARWVGNVKRYRLGTDTTSGDAMIIDKNGQPAVDNSTGFFRENASSYWSFQDGKDVAKGGVAGMLGNPATRSIFTWTGADRSPTASNGVTGSSLLTTSAHALTTNNTAITNALMGVGTTDNAARDKAILWGRGLDPETNQARQQLADVLHNEPRLVAYNTDEDLVRVEKIKNGTESPSASPEQLYMFFGTNEGFIHAVDPSNGEEQFAFIPKELLPNLNAYHTNPKGSNAKRYGMDGQINLWVEYGAINPQTKSRSITKNYLYAGMRRGGRNYYALDVGSITSPALKWVIKGGATPGFEKLGQTWSTPKLADINVNGTKTKVLIFTGGYDPQQDDDGINIPFAKDNYGNSLYIVNAETGQLIWRAGHTSESGANLKLGTMTHSMPADPVIIDINNDGLSDIIYAADTRAQVFRFDINNANTGANNLGVGGRIASFGGSDALNNRRLFNMPDVALVRERGGKTYFTISLGSGYRAHPLNEDTIDRFYVMRDPNVFTKPSTYTTLTESDLVDASSVDLTDAQAAGILQQIAALETEIKALNKSVDDARVLFNAYKDSSGFTAKYNAMLQANSSANDRQNAIDSLMAADPYLLAHAPESLEQSKLQQGLLASQQTLQAFQQARAEAANDLAAKDAAYDSASADKAAAVASKIAAQAAYDSDESEENEINLENAVAAEEAAINAYTNASAAAQAALDKKNALQTQAESLAGLYSTLTNLQGELSSRYQQILEKEQEIISAKAAAEDETAIASLETELENLNTNYANAPLTTERDALNTGTTTTALRDALSKLNTAIAGGNTSTIQIALANLETLTGPAAGPTQSIEDLLARDEAAKNTALTNNAENQASNVALLKSHETQRLIYAGQASTAQTEANAIANATYEESSALLSAEQLAAAKALYGNDLTVFESYQYLIDQAQLATLDTNQGLPAKRASINSLYAQLTPGNNYVPNQTLLAKSDGWFIRLPKGEKVLSSPLIFRGAVFFNTFSPRGESVTTCGPDVGRGRAYALNLRDAGSILTQNDTPIRSYALIRSGIPPAPSVVFSDNAPPKVIIGTEVLNDKDPKLCVEGVDCPIICNGDVDYCEKEQASIKKTYWREN